MKTYLYWVETEEEVFGEGEGYVVTIRELINKETKELGSDLVSEEYETEGECYDRIAEFEEEHDCEVENGADLA